MVQPTEQLEEPSENLFDRLVNALTQARDSRRGKIDLPTIEFADSESVTLEDVRAKVDELMRKRKP